MKAFGHYSEFLYNVPPLPTFTAAPPPCPPDCTEHRACCLRLIERLRAGLRGFLWLGNNLHNIRESPDDFRKFYEAALEDARAALPEAGEVTL